MKLVTDLSVSGRPILTGEPFTPATLFRQGENGLFFDPSVAASLYTTHDGGANSVPGNPVGRIEDGSGNGNDAIQSISTMRPSYGRRPSAGLRNLVHKSQLNLDGSGLWVNNQSGTTSGASSVINDDPETTASTPFIQQISDTHYILWNVVQSSELLSGEIYRVRARIRAIGDTITAPWVVIGGTTANLTGFPITPAAGWQWVEFDLVSDGTALKLGWAGSGNNWSISTIQVERNTEASTYQRVLANGYDVTEAGMRDVYYLFNDGIDDALASTLPYLGTNATVAYASDKGATIQTGQTIGAGGFDILRDTRLFAMLVIDRALSTAETQRVTRFLETRAGGYTA